MNGSIHTLGGVGYRLWARASPLPQGIATASLLLALLLPGAATAAPASGTEPEPATTQEADTGEQTTEGEDDAPREADARPRDADTPDVFVPTEEVSEDLSVAFPVDI